MRVRGKRLGGEKLTDVVGGHNIKERIATSDAIRGSQI
jgi:hypothetical protein